MNNTKVGLGDRFKGAVKNFFGGYNRTISPSNYRVDDSGTFVYNIRFDEYNFVKVNLEELIRVSYYENPVGFGVVQKMNLANRKLDFKYISNGEESSSNPEIDFYEATFQLLISGTCILQKLKPIGFDPVYKVLETHLWREQIQPDNTIKDYYNGNPVNNLDDYIFIKLPNPLNNSWSKLGLSPFYSAYKPIDGLNNLYISDSSLLRNKGADIMLTNDSDTPITGVDSSQMDKELNSRISGARRNGQVATSTAKLRAIQLGRSAKDLALWEGVKFKLRDICTAYNLDSALFNDPEAKKYDNVDLADISLYSTVISYVEIITKDKNLLSWIKDDFRIDYIDISTERVHSLQAREAKKVERKEKVQGCIIELNEAVNSGKISRGVALFILTDTWGLSEEEADLYISDQSKLITQSEIENNEQEN